MYYDRPCPTLVTILLKNVEFESVFTSFTTTFPHSLAKSLQMYCTLSFQCPTWRLQLLLRSYFPKILLARLREVSIANLSLQNHSISIAYTLIERLQFSRSNRRPFILISSISKLLAKQTFTFSAPDNGMHYCWLWNRFMTPWIPLIPVFLRT